jgi:hypothetical protein
MRVMRLFLRAFLVLTSTIAVFGISLSLISMRSPDWPTETVFDLNQRVGVLFGLSILVSIIMLLGGRFLVSRNPEYEKQIQLIPKRSYTVSTSMSKRPDALSIALMLIIIACVLGAGATVFFSPLSGNVELGPKGWIVHHRSRAAEIVTAQEAKHYLWNSIKFCSLVSSNWMTVCVLVARSHLKAIKIP